MNKIFIILLVFISVHLHSDEEIRDKSLVLDISCSFIGANKMTIDREKSIVDLECEPSSIVNGCVNVINGSFMDHAVDLVVPGPEPIKIERAYSSQDGSVSSLGASWHLNHFGSLMLVINDDMDYWTIKVKEEFGSETFYEDQEAEHRTQLSKMRICKEQLKVGGTNTGSGLISGKTNLRNKSALYSYNDGTAIMRNTIKIF